MKANKGGKFKENQVSKDDGIGKNERKVKEKGRGKRGKRVKGML